jgi:O-antigen ligase
MAALRYRLGRLSERDLLVATGAAAVATLLALAGAQKLGLAGLLLPLALVVLFILVRSPLAMATLLVGLVILCEGPTFGLFHFTSHLLDHVSKGLTPLDALVALTVVSVGADLIRRRQPLRVPRPLALPLLLLVFAMIAGAVTGHAAGGGVRSVLVAENVPAYLLLLPIAISNLQLGRHQLIPVIGAATALAIVKAGLGLIEIVGHYGASIEGTARLTYYEPTANWLIMIALFGVLAMVLARARPPRWTLLGTPLLIASLLLSYRRSFWTAAVLGLLLVLVLGTSPAGRRMLVPVGVLLAVAIWLLGSFGFQSSGSPVVNRFASLAPSKLEANVQDRYRLDERANVLAAIRQHPITGLGLAVPWAATSQPLSVEHPEGRFYVHFAALWFWLKLGILGVLAYIGVLVGAAILAWQAWRRSPEPVLRAFSLASLCGVAGLVVIETTASFTGVDPRFTVLLTAQLGLLGLIVRTAGPARSQGQPRDGGLTRPAGR